MKEEDTYKTIFKSRKGLYEWLLMSFGSCNIIATFVCLMNDILRLFLDSFAILYLDEILVYRATWEDHNSHLKKVLKTLKKAPISS